MDKRIEKLKTPEHCVIFARNATEKNRPDLAEQAIKRAVQLRAEALGVHSEAEKEALQAVFAYEEVLARKSGKRTRASRTWQMIDRHGIIKAVERAVNRKTETQGYTALVDMGLEEFAFEAVILRHPDQFSKEAVMRSKARLNEWSSGENPAPNAKRGSVFTTVQDAEQIAKAQAVFEDRVKNVACKQGVIMLGYQGGGREVMAYHVATLDFWVAFADSGNRYWNALGVGNPFEGDSTIIAEINPPKSGIDRNIAGLFIKDKKGVIYLAHRGKIGGGRKGIGKEAFLDWREEPMDLVYDDDRVGQVIVIGALDDIKLLENLSEFTKSVSEFKAEAVSGTTHKCQNRSQT